MNVGLDIGANSIKAVSLGVTKSGFIIEGACSSGLSPTVTENGSVMDYGELVHGIMSVMESGAFPSKEVAVALKGPSVIARRLSVYTENPEELKEGFRWIAGQYAYVDAEEMSIDYEIIPNKDLYNHVYVLMTAAKKDTVTDFVSVIESSKITPKVIEAEAFSLCRLYRSLNLPKAETVMLVHVGYVGSLVLFMKDGGFDFCHEVDKGGKHFTDILEKELGVESREAENVKIDPDLHSDPEAVRNALNGIISLEYLRAVDNVFKFYTLRGGEAPSIIYLSGGACETFGLKDALAVKYSVPAELLDPWQSVEISPNLKNFPGKDKYAYNVALGLAMHGKVY